jgi:CheY-like chemotaxis protein
MPDDAPLLSRRMMDGESAHKVHHTAKHPYSARNNPNKEFLESKVFRKGWHIACSTTARGVVERFIPKDAVAHGVVLIVEDERVSRKALGTLLASSGYSTETVGSAEEALEIMNDGPTPEVALIDLDLPGMSGAELISKLARLQPSVKAILITAVDRDRLDPFLRRFGVTHLRKPLNFDCLLQVLSQGAVH